MTSQWCIFTVAYSLWYIIKEVKLVTINPSEKKKELAIGNNIKELANARGENISDLQRGLSVSYTTAFDLYHNKTKQITFEMMDRLCHYFGVGPCELFPFRPESSKVIQHTEPIRRNKKLKVGE